MADDGIGLAEVLLGLPGFRVLEVVETAVEVIVTVETTADFTGCRTLRGAGRGRRIVGRSTSGICPASGGRRGWCGSSGGGAAPTPTVTARTWTEHSDALDAQAVLTRRAGAEACRQVGEHARPVAQVAREFGVCWWTVMNAVIEHGTPLVDDPDRVGPVRQLGIDETSFLAATPDHPTVYATGLVDLERHVVIDMVEGNACR